MRKLSFLLIGILSITVLISSCKKDDDSFGPPTINFIGGEGYIDGDATIAVNTIFKVGIAASANTESNKEIKTLNLKRSIDGVTFIDTTLTINQNQFNGDFQFNAQQAGIIETIMFTITDDAGQTASKSLTITYEATAIPVIKDTGVTMGSFNDDAGSFYSTLTTTVYNISEASNNQEIIDFLFYLGATNGSTIASPADADANTVYAISDWTTKNATLFVKTDITSAEFDAIGDSFNFPEFTGEASSITNLNSNDVLMYRTVLGYVGLIKVNSINSRGDFISIDVIVTAVAK